MTEATETNEGAVPLQSDTVIRTFLIADVRGYTRFTLERGDEAAATLATKFAAIAKEVVTAHGGQVTELRGDEALAVFASSRLALRAAAELQARFADAVADDPSLPLRVGVGLDAGEAIPVDGGFRGAALNLAARLCSLAGPGEVLASEGVVHLARKVEGIEYMERGRVELKGFAEPVGVVQVTLTSAGTTGESGPDQVVVDAPQAPEQVPAERPKQQLPIGGFLGSLPSGPLVARASELDRILNAVDSAADGHGKLVILTGEPGVGKTRLAQEATVSAHNRGFLIAAGRCYEQQQSVPFYPFQEALTTAYALAPADIRSDAPRRWPYLARLLPDQLGTIAPTFADSQEEQIRLFRAVASFLQAIAAQTPLALLLDDLQWADSSSLALVEHLARQTHGDRMLLVGTFRDVGVGAKHPLEAALRDLDREQLVQRVPVRRLDEEGTAALIAEVVGEIQSASEFARLLYGRTEGNPFFTQQVLRALVENGSVYRHDGHWERRAVQEIEVPESVRSVIEQRISRLDEPTQEILREASVLGHTFAFDDLLRLKSSDETDTRLEDEIDVALTRAAEMGLLRQSGTDEYTFDHALTQQALYAALPPRRRRRLHLASGEVLEQLPSRKREQRVTELAWHFLQGGDQARALQYAVLAGDAAEAVFAHGEAEQHYRQALSLAQDIEDSAKEAGILERLGGVLKLKGQQADALEVLERAAHMHRDAHDLEAEGRVMSQIGVILSWGPAPSQGIRRLQPLVEALERRGPSPSLAQLYSALVHLYNSSGNQAEQLATSRRLLELARELQDERLLAEAEAHYGTSLMNAGQLTEALPVLEESIRRSEQVGDLSAMCQALDVAAVTYHSLRQPDRVMIYRERSVEIAERLADPREASFRAVEVTWTAFLLGDWRKARAYAERALVHALSLDELQVYLQPLHALGELCLYAGEREEALGYLREYSVIAEHIGAVESLREAQALLAEADILNGDAEAGLARLAPFLERPGWEDHLSFLLTLVWAYIETGHMREAEEVAARTLAEARQQRVPIGIVEALRVDAMTASRQEQWEDAEARYDEGRLLAQEIRYPWGEARHLYGLGLMYSRRGDAERARTYLEDARTRFEQLGASLYGERAEAALERLA